MSAAAPFWTADRHAARRPALLIRNAIAAAFREKFAREDFVEVDPASLQASPGGEAHLHAFATRLKATSGEGVDAYLHTSPEFAMKKLLAAGETKIFSLGHVFRNRERGPLHAPEFTMLEWYRAGAPLEAIERDCLELVALAARIAGTKSFAYRERRADPFLPAERLSLHEAFRAYAGIDLDDSLRADGTGERDTLARQAKALGLRVTDDDTWPDLFSKVLSDRIEPNLGASRPTILHSYPASEAALARLSHEDPRLAKRFELYICGVELANAFDELTDAEEQRRRFAHEREKKRQIYDEDFPIDEDFLDALKAMPAASGAALGFDRLAMLASGAERVEDVQWAPVFATERS